MKFGLALLLNFLELMKDKVIDFIKDLNIEVSIVDNHNIPIKDISMIKYAREFDLCYVDGPAYHLIKEKKNLFLLCPLDFKEVNPNISYIKTKDPKLLFYKLSYVFNPINGYIDLDPMINNRYPGAFIDKTVKIGKNVRILPGVTIYPNTEIGNNVVIESGSVIGCTGLLWVWDNDDKIMLSTNGKVIIGDGCHISSNVSIVRGACNEETIIANGVMIAPGTAIGHGCIIEKNVHIANNVTLSGSVVIEKDCFLGSASTVQPAIHLKSGSVLGSGSVLTKSYNKSSVFAGIPARDMNKSPNQVKGVPVRNK